MVTRFLDRLLPCVSDGGVLHGRMEGVLWKRSGLVREGWGGLARSDLVPMIPQSEVELKASG